MHAPTEELMESCKAFYKFPAFLLLIIFASARSYASAKLQSTADGGDFISATCNRTLYFDVCLSSLRSDPRSATSDLGGLAEIALNLSISHGSETLTGIDNLMSGVANYTEYVKDCLNDCEEEYSEAIDNLCDAIQALGNRSLDTVNALVTAAMTDSDTCEEGFEEVPGYTSPISDRNQYFSMLCSNFLAITALLF